MSKRILLATLSMSLLILSGCGSSKPSKSTETLSDQKYSTKKLPKFYLNPPTSADFYYGVGEAKKSSPSMAKDVAETRARREVAASIETKVSSVVYDFMQESGIGGDARALEFNEVVSKQVVDQVMQGCKVIDRELMKDGNRAVHYVLMEFPLASAISAAKSAIKDQEAMFNEFKARQGLDRLEAELESLNTSK